MGSQSRIFSWVNVRWCRRYELTYNIAAENQNATYVHFRSHVLSLALSSSCKNVKVIQNLFAKVGRVTWFLGGGAKRKQILLEATGRDAYDGLMELLKASEENNEALSASFDAMQRGSNASTVLDKVVQPAGLPELQLSQLCYRSIVP